MPITGLGDEIAEYIATNIPSLVLDQNLFVGRTPDAPDASVTIHERGGAEPLMVLGTPAVPSAGQDFKIDQPTFQVMVKDPSYATGETTAAAIFKLLEGLTEITLNAGGSLFHLIWALQSVVHLGRDDRQRHEFVQNFRCLVSNENR